MLRHVAKGESFTDPDVANIRTLIVLRHASIKTNNAGVAQEDTYAALANIFAPLLLKPIHTQLACFSQKYLVKCLRCNIAAREQCSLVPYHIVFPRKGEVIPLSADDIALTMQNLFVTCTEIDPVAYCQHCKHIKDNEQLAGGTFVRTEIISHSSDRGIVFISSFTHKYDPLAANILGTSLALTSAHPKGFSIATIIAILLYVPGLNQNGTTTGQNGHYYVKELRGGNKVAIYDGFTGLQKSVPQDAFGDPGQVVAVVLQFCNRKTPHLAHLLGPCNSLTGPLSAIMKQAKIDWDTQLCPGHVVHISDDEAEIARDSSAPRQATRNINKKVHAPGLRMWTAIVSTKNQKM
jgi:hypothetical protein